MKRLENKIVFITGGNSGIGKASALESAREGATLVVADLENKDHKQTLEEITVLGAVRIFCVFLTKIYSFKSVSLNRQKLWFFYYLY
jgi:NAD(P)-dependent dehydrogenase (short-subunit alcohol dehydrogenase family)